jgi:hypothetical protein
LFRARQQTGSGLHRWDRHKFARSIEEHTMASVTNISIREGFGFGSALAIAVSYANNHSIIWAIIHGLFSWLYVAYFVLLK